MNKFLSCTRRDCPIDVYYEEFIKFSCHAPHLTKEHSLRKFFQGLEGSLSDEVEALRPSSLVDALIGAKSKLSSLQKKAAIGERERLLLSNRLKSSDRQDFFNLKWTILWDDLPAMYLIKSDT